MAELIHLLETNQSDFVSIVPFDPANDKLLKLDFTSNNKELTDEILNDNRLFCNYINQRLSNANARYGIGGYDENRPVYGKSRIFDSNSSPTDGGQVGVEPRRIHLGIDIWGKPHTAVVAPLNGIVHSFAFNDRPGDYGVTIILSHQLQGTSFYTLYGHLSLNSIKNLQGGERISKEDVFAEFGSPDENGQWPPHLHFQVIADLQQWSGDYPGVCAHSEREIYLANSPDPDLILQMMKYV